MPDIWTTWGIPDLWIIPLSIIMFGAIVDIAQFVWLVRRAFMKMKRKMYNKVKAKILEDMKKDKP